MILESSYSTTGDVVRMSSGRMYHAAGPVLSCKDILLFVVPADHHELNVNLFISRCCLHASCGREAAPCFVSLDISLSQSRSLKDIENGTIR